MAQGEKDQLPGKVKEETSFAFVEKGLSKELRAKALQRAALQGQNYVDEQRSTKIMQLAAQRLDEVDDQAKDVIEQLNAYLTRAEEKIIESTYTSETVVDVEAELVKCRVDIWKNNGFTLDDGTKVELPAGFKESAEKEFQPIGTSMDIKAEFILDDKEHPILICNGHAYLFDANYIGTGNVGTTHIAKKLGESSTEDQQVILKMQVGAVEGLDEKDAAELVEQLEDKNTDKDELADNIENAGENAFYNAVTESRVTHEDKIARVYKFDDKRPLGIESAKADLDLSTDDMAFKQAMIFKPSTIAQLTVIRAHDARTIPTNIPVYIHVQNYVPGEMLAFDKDEKDAKLKDFFVRTGVDKYKLALAIIDGVQHFQKFGIQHRDIRPDNMKISVTNGEIKVYMLDTGASTEKGEAFLSSTTEGYTHPRIFAMEAENDHKPVSLIVTETDETYSTRQVLRYLGIEVPLKENDSSDSLNALHTDVVALQHKEQMALHKETPPLSRTPSTASTTSTGSLASEPSALEFWRTQERQGAIKRPKTPEEQKQQPTSPPSKDKPYRGPG